MINVLLTAIIGSVLIAGVAFSPLLSGQFHSAYAQNNATTMSGNMTGNATTMSANMTGNTTSAQGGNSVTISPGSSVPSNGKFFVPDTLRFQRGQQLPGLMGIQHCIQLPREVRNLEIQEQEQNLTQATLLQEKRFNTNSVSREHLTTTAHFILI